MSTIANVEMARAWDGDEGERWAEHAERYESIAQRTWQRFLDHGFIVASDRVLDIGCGTGKSTRDAARMAFSGWAHGVDLSSQMLERARRRSEAEGITNISFEQADAQVHPFAAAAFDIAISSFGVMFFSDPVAAFTNIARALRPGGRLAVLVIRELARNEWVVAMREALAVGRQLPEPSNAPGPFAFADPAHVQAVLGGAGFTDVELESIDESAWLGSDADDAFAFIRTHGMVKGLTENLDEETRARALDQLYAAILAHQTDEGVLVGSSSWLVTARRP